MSGKKYIIFIDNNNKFYQDILNDFHNKILCYKLIYYDLIW